MLGQLFETATQIVTKQAQRAPLERQIRIRCGRKAQSMDLVLEPHQRIVRWRQRIGRQRFNRVGHQNIKAAVGMIRMPGVQEHRKRQVAQTGKPELGGVCTPGQGHNSGEAHVHVWHTTGQREIISANNLAGVNDVCRFTFSQP